MYVINRGNKDKSATEIIKEENKKRVLDAVEKCLIEYGIDATTIDLVAERAKISQRSIHRYYGNRENMLHIFVDNYLKRYYEYLSIQIKESNQSYSSGLEKINNYYNFYAKWFEKDYKIVVLVGELEVYFSKSKQMKEIFQRHVEQSRSITNMCRDMLKEGMEDGSIRIGLNIDVLSEVIVNTNTGLGRRMALVYKKKEFEHIPDVMEQLNELRDILVNYIKN